MRALMALILLSLAAWSVDATLTIEKDVDQRSTVTIEENAPSPSEAGRAAFEIFRADLKITGHFLPRGEYRIRSASGDSDYLLRYRLERSDRGASLQVRLLKRASGATVFERRYTIASAARYPFLIHRAVTEINDRLGFASVAWINRYVLFARYTGRKESEIAVADYTLHYVKPIIRGGLNLFPLWADSRQSGFYYTGYSGNLPTLYHLDLATGRRTRILSSQGMLVCSDVSADGRRLLLTMAPQGQPDIFEYELQSGNSRRLTTYSGIDVGGKYADAEQSVVFVSNRLGYATIFKKPLSGGPASQLVFHGRNNDSVDVHGKKVVYSSRESDNSFQGGKAFNLYLTTTSGDYVRPLTSNGINQFPRFSSDGNTVLYIKRSYQGNAIGYLGLGTNLSLLFPLGERKIQSIDW